MGTNHEVKETFSLVSDKAMMLEKSVFNVK